MGKKRPVVQSTEEAQRAGVAEQLLSAGKKNFESVYGPKVGGSFDLGDDMRAMQGVKMMTEEQVQQNLGAGAEAEMSEVPDGVDFTPESTVPPELIQPELTKDMLPPDPSPQEEQQEEEGLSEDPDKRAQQVAEFLASKYPGAPNTDTLKEWRRIHGGAFMLQIADRIFIYRYLKRQEWIQLNANPKAAELSEDDVENEIFNRCVLWPKYNQIQKAGMPAGGISMVVQQIRLQSLFLDPAYVATLTVKI
jgi:hypothetical protein